MISFIVITFLLCGILHIKRSVNYENKSSHSFMPYGIGSPLHVHILLGLFNNSNAEAPDTGTIYIDLGGRNAQGPEVSTYVAFAIPASENRSDLENLVHCSQNITDNMSTGTGPISLTLPVGYYLVFLEVIPESNSMGYSGSYCGYGCTSVVKNQTSNLTIELTDDEEGLFETTYAHDFEDTIYGLCIQDTYDVSQTGKLSFNIPSGLEEDEALISSISDDGTGLLKLRNFTTSNSSLYADIIELSYTEADDTVLISGARILYVTAAGLQLSYTQNGTTKYCFLFTLAGFNGANEWDGEGDILIDRICDNPESISAIETAIDSYNPSGSGNNPGGTSTGYAGDGRYATDFVSSHYTVFACLNDYSFDENYENVEIMTENDAKSIYINDIYCSGTEYLTIEAKEENYGIPASSFIMKKHTSSGGTENAGDESGYSILAITKYGILTVNNCFLFTKEGYELYTDRITNEQMSSTSFRMSMPVLTKDPRTMDEIYEALELQAPVQSGYTFLGYPEDGDSVSTYVYYGGDFGTTRYTWFSYIEESEYNGALEIMPWSSSIPEVTGHSYDYSSYPYTGGDIALTSYMMLKDFQVTDDGILTASIKRYGSDGTLIATHYTDAVIKLITRDGVYVTVQADNGGGSTFTYTCFLFTPRGEWRMKHECNNQTYAGDDNKMPSPIIFDCADFTNESASDRIEAITDAILDYHPIY